MWGITNVRDIHVRIHLRYLFMQVLTDSWKLGSICPDHSQLIYLR